jgi:hypothetical protein
MDSSVVPKYASGELRTKLEPNLDKEKPKVMTPSQAGNIFPI